MFKELETVVLLHDIEPDGLKKGAIGAIVEIYGNGEAYEVEFVDQNSGHTLALLTLSPQDLMKFESMNTTTWAIGSDIQPDFTPTRVSSKAETNQYFQQYL